ncbi:MAG: beta-aspartyl-peptidase [Myxococcota bacterium]|nr:beta-aspartyl-peptidase [Myxococcota bacterium]
MIRHLRNADVYGPSHLGRKDIYVCGAKIAAMGDALPAANAVLPQETLDCSGLRLIPGLIDAHVHSTGGGGEAGYGSRVPPLQLTQLTRWGVTTCVGLLGTDATTRTIRDLVAQTYGLRRHGMTAYCYTGSYRFPVATLTGSIRDDIVFIDPIVGVGELAISDHRSSQITLDELLRVASDAHVAGLMTGKAGLLHLHLGDGQRRFELIHQALEKSELPARVFHPTHVNRNLELFNASFELAARGVTVDVTAFPEADGGLLASDAIAAWLDGDGDNAKLTCSSDGGGCMPVFDADGTVERMGVGTSKVLIDTIKSLTRRGYALEDFLPMFTENVARVLRLTNKGRIATGQDADIVALDSDGNVRYVMGRGDWLVFDGEPVRQSMFEDTRKVES